MVLAALQSNANLCRIVDPDDLTLDILHQYLASFLVMVQLVIPITDDSNHLI